MNIGIFWTITRPRHLTKPCMAGFVPFGMQLTLDLYPMPDYHPFGNDAYVMNVGGWRNCVVYGADSFPPTDAVFDSGGLLCFEFPAGHPWIDQMRSEAWSANCSHFLLFQETGAFLIPVFGGQSFCDPLRSLGFMQECLRGLEAAENANFGKKPKQAKTSLSPDA